jgi:phosphatidylglycerol:prolipoprotein diacylglycerol transferase
MPDGFDIPIPFLNQPFHIYFYGILIMLGVIAAALMARLEAKRRGLDPEIVWDMLFWLVLAGIVGARIWHILTPPPSMVEQGITTRYYLTHPLDMLNIRAGGLGIPGAVIGGGLAMWIYLRNKKMSFAVWADIAAPGLALAQAIGRWGNFFNQELYGAPTNLPWKIYIDPLHRLPGFENYSYYHPLFLYESLWNLTSMFFLLWLGRRFAERLKAGDIFLTYLIAYPIGRFCLDFLRLDASQLGGINANQTFVAIVAVVAVGLLIWGHRFAKAAAPSARKAQARVRRYSSAKYGLSFDVPKGMELYTTRNPGPLRSQLSSQTPFILVNRDFTEENINVKVSENVSESDVDDFKRSLDENPDMPLPNYKNIAVDFIQVGVQSDKKAVEHIYIMRGNILGKIRQVTFQYNGRGFTFTCATAVDRFDAANKKFFSALFDSITFSVSSQL